jgi:hypothetical protein
MFKAIATINRFIKGRNKETYFKKMIYFIFLNMNIKCINEIINKSLTSSSICLKKSPITRNFLRLIRIEFIACAWWSCCT